MSQLHAIKHSTSPLVRNHSEKKLFIAGVGAVGCTLVKQVENHPNLRILGICNSRHVQWFKNSESRYQWRDLQSAPEKNWEEIIRKIASYKHGSVVFVDATGNSEVCELYPELIRNGVHIVTPSKLANTRSQQAFDRLHQLTEEYNVEFHYETNVGAGLPIINSLQNLISSGDEILQVSGVVSGTMTYLFSELEQGKPFSETVIRARSLGYAEPDPRDDLSGEDVARKFLILARICGLKAERDEIEVESLIPEELRAVSSREFMDRLHEYDASWFDKIDAANRRGDVLRYTGTLENGKIRVGIEPVPKLSALGGLAGTNNLVEFRTKRYSDQPLVIQGPGAGKEVTAAGVLADILKIN